MAQYCAKYGVALYHCGLNSFHIETKEPQRGNGPPPTIRRVVSTISNGSKRR
jgi:hypothetical protein